MYYNSNLPKYLKVFSFHNKKEEKAMTHFLGICLVKTHLSHHQICLVLLYLAVVEFRIAAVSVVFIVDVIVIDVDTDIAVFLVFVDFNFSLFFSFLCYDNYYHHYRFCCQYFLPFGLCLPFS